MFPLLSYLKGHFFSNGQDEATSCRASTILFQDAAGIFRLMRDFPRTDSSSIYPRDGGFETRAYEQLRARLLREFPIAAFNQGFDQIGGSVPESCRAISVSPN